jgi:hypothetical protein
VRTAFVVWVIARKRQWKQVIPGLFCYISLPQFLSYHLVSNKSKNANVRGGSVDRKAAIPPLKEKHNN